MIENSWRDRKGGIDLLHLRTPYAVLSLCYVGGVKESLCQRNIVFAYFSCARVSHMSALE
jgi:hypothetical protein